MHKNLPKIICCLVLCWAVCMPMFCQAVQSMTVGESREARQKMIDYSKQFVGVPYVYGGASRSGMDCSGLIFTVANDAIGVKLPRSTAGIYSAVRIINDSEKEAGDLVFFKTVGSRISHVGLYLGNNQFIHAASDGPNTGVIISSLKESYWSRTYAGAGRFLPATGDASEQRVILNGGSATTGAGSTGTDSAGAGSNAQGGGAFAPSGSGSAAAGSSGGSGGGAGGFFRRVALDGTLAGDWTFFTASRFHLVSRGVTLDVHARYAGGNLEPGFGFSLSYDPAMKAFKLPLLFSLTVATGIRVYAGPVFTMGKPVAPGTDNDRVKGSVFPGVLGLCLQTPALKAGKVELSLLQDIRYTVFNDMDGAALSFIDSLASGLVFSTGIRVTFPLSHFI